MDPAQDSGRFLQPSPTARGLVQDARDVKALRALAKERKYVVRHDDSYSWLEWSDGLTEPPEDPAVANALQGFAPFEPMAYPLLRTHLAGASVPAIPEPTFLVLRPAFDAVGLRSMRGGAAPHVRDLAGRLELGEDRRAHPDKLGWLIAHRDALALEIDRCAARLDLSRSGVGTTGSAIRGARGVLRVWLAEASRCFSLQFAELPASAVWEGFSSGAPLDESKEDIDGIPPLMSMIGGEELARALGVEGLDRSLIVATASGLRHYARIRDAITAPAYEIWPRLLAAETVIQAALVGTPLDDAWMEEAVRRQQDEEAQRARNAAEAKQRDEAKAQLRRTLLSPETRLPYIVSTLYPQASQNRASRSVWRDTWDLFVAEWESAGLPVETRPYPTFEALKDAAAEARRRERMARGRQMG
jgi:hypothetical protein